MRRLSAVLVLATILINLYPAAWAERVDSDAYRILSIHQSVLLAHLTRDVDALLAYTAADYVLVNRGEVSYPTVDERRKRFSHYFEITTFSEYKDLIPPILKISDDESTAWLIAQVEVSGSQKVTGEDHPLHFVSAWIELYEKRDEVWVQIGNVSNFKQ